MSTWFTSDQHFGDQQIIGLCRRPFASVREQDDELVRRWNAVVGPQDEVWVLGDVAVNPLRQSLQRIRQLHGLKRLVVGNHDEPFEQGKQQSTPFLRLPTNRAANPCVHQSGYGPVPARCPAVAVQRLHRPVGSLCVWDWGEWW